MIFFFRRTPPFFLIPSKLQYVAGWSNRVYARPSLSFMAQQLLGIVLESQCLRRLKFRNVSKEGGRICCSWRREETSYKSVYFPRE